MIWQITGVCLAGALLSVILKQYKKNEYAMAIAIICTAFVITVCSLEITDVVNSAKELAAKSGLNYDFFLPVLKITGIAYVAQMGAELCRDVGENTVASKIELGGKIIICALAMPIVCSLFDIIADIL
ncbi:MAG: stage III sporulation AC/AD family protein [Bacillota bacterium]|nr:stage III sporulation AC/AD family protein [Bacillota bacterium]